MDEDEVKNLQPIPASFFIRTKKCVLMISDFCLDRVLRRFNIRRHRRSRNKSKIFNF